MTMRMGPLLPAEPLATLLNPPDIDCSTPPTLGCCSSA